MDGLVRSGRLEIVRDSQVVAALASWDRSLRDYLEVAQIARRNTDTLLVPALVKRGDVALALIGRSTLRANEAKTDAPPVATIAIDDEIKGLIAHKVESVGHARQLLNRAREAAEEAVAAIQVARSN